MNLSWMFGSTMEQHHLLYAYLSVWFIQGGYCAWIAWRWLSEKKNAPSAPPPTSTSREDF